MDRLAEIEVFIRAVETGSFSAAARYLDVGQPAVSKTIARLETRLDVKLAFRSAQGLVLTEAGHNFYERAKHALEEANEAERAAQGATNGLSGRLRVAAAVTFARLHIMPQLSSFIARHPSLDIDLLLDDRSIDLVAEGIDVSFRVSSRSNFTFPAEKIGRCRRWVLGTPTYFARRGEPSSPADLVVHEVISYLQPAGGSSWRFRQGTTETSVDLAGHVRVSAAEALREAILAGLGLAIAPDWLFADELKVGTVRPVLPGWSLPAAELWAVFPARQRISSKARVFTGFVEDILRDNGWAVT